MNLPNYYYYFIICCLIYTAPSAKSLIQEISNHNTSLVNGSNGVSTDPRPWRDSYTSHKHANLRTVHGSLNIMGWGVLMPIGIITARYLRKTYDDWYSLHILSHVSGFILGTLGWGLGMSLKNAAKEHSLSTHGILGTVIFAFAIFQPDEEHTWRKYWVTCHNVIGYALIVLIIVNIFQGINKQQGGATRIWGMIYAVVFGILGLSAIALELIRWVVHFKH